MRNIPLVSALLLLLFVGGALAQTPKQTARDEVGNLNPVIRDISRKLWQYSELALREERSAGLLTRLLEQEGFSVERGVAGMPTAFVATYGTGKPVIGVLAEYDALPGTGNAIVPKKQARDDGVTDGQGCGHNLFGAASVSAAIAIRRAIDQRKLKGTVVLYGSPAEETGVGKVYMAKAGIFDDADAVLDWHPNQKTKVRNQKGLALNNFEVEFFGQAAHAAGDPWNGRSALDAVELMNHGANMMREHVNPTTRIHYVIPNAGDAPNVVPEYAKVWYFVRDVDRERVDKWYAWILDIAKGAALATRTEHKVRLITGVHEYNQNRPIQEALQKNLDVVGAPRFTEEEQQFAKRLQASLGIEEKGYQSKVEPLAEGIEEVRGGSTDVAEVSFIAPTAGLNVTTAADGVPWHSWATTACHGTEAGVKGAAVAAEVLAMTGLDLLTDAELLDRAKAEFQKSTEGKPYQSPVPRDQEPPLP